MFQPHSVRGLLSRRNNSRPQEESTDGDNHKDPDFESTIEAKLIIKDIEHQIKDIRQWRSHQKQMLSERLASNKAVADVMKVSAKELTQKQEKCEAQANQRLLSQMQFSQQIEETEKEDRRGDTNLFQYITNSNKLVEERKNQMQSQGTLNLTEQTLLSQVEGLGSIVFRNFDKRTEGKSNVNKQLLKQQLEQIEAQLREAQQLLKD